MDNALHLISSYLDGEALSPEQLALLERWICGSKANAAEFARLSFDSQEVRAHLIAEQSADLVFLEPGESDEGDEDPADLQDDRYAGDVMSEVVDQALALRRQHEIEDEANRKLAAQQQEDARNRRFELRRQAEAANAQHRPVVIPTPLVWLGLAALIGLVATIAIVFNQPTPSTTTTPNNNPPGSTAQTPEAGAAEKPYVASIRSSIGARWVGLGYGQNQRMESGASVTLSEGLAEVVFEDGAAVIVQAPATFEPTGPNAMRMVSGRITATIPASAHGFTVQTPAGLITDYGTEFGVIVNADGQTLAQTFSGRIGLTPVGGTEVDLPAGDAVVAAPSGRVRSVEPDALAFVRSEEYTAQQEADVSPRARWLAYCYDMQRDPEVLGLFLADSVRPGQDRSVIPNLAGERGRLVTISEGRFVERAHRAEDGLRLDTDGGAFTFEVDGPLDEVTLLVWAHVDPGDNRDLRTLIASDENDATGAVHWNLNFSSGAAASRVALRNAPAATDEPWPMDNALFDGGQLPVGWHLYAVSISGQSGQVRHYLDGVLLAQARMGHRGPLVLGTTRVGAWLMDPQVGDHTRVLRGSVGLVAVVEGARDAAQMQALYQRLSQAQSQGGTPPAPPDF